MSPKTSIRSVVAALTLAMAATLLTPVGPAHAVDGSITGRVESSLGGTLSGLTVELYSEDSGGIEFVTTTTTNGGGIYTFSGLSYQDYYVKVLGGSATPPHADRFHDGTYSFLASIRLTVDSATPIVRNITMSPGGTISGTVTGEFGVPENLYVVMSHFAGGVQSFLNIVPTIAVDKTWEVTNLPAGEWKIRYSDLLPSATNYRTHYHDQVLNADIQETVSLAGQQTVEVEAYMTEAGPIPHERLSGSDRYATAVAISSSRYGSANGAPDTYVYVASGANYPDALSAAPAAARRNAPLLLTLPNSLPAAVASEIERIDPAKIIVAGGPGAVSNAVFTSLQGLMDNPSDVIRIGGANRYETSRLLVQEAFGSASTAFIATGRNFPDALAAGAAAAYREGPVLLVDGAATSADTATRDLIDGLGISEIYIAGGASVVTNSIASNLATIPGVTSVTRLSGADRYATSLAINQEIFPTTYHGYIATGMGFADALAGAAWAGSQGAPLYTVPRTCIPGGALAHFREINVRELVLFGGTSVLTAGVANLTRC